MKLVDVRDDLLVASLLDAAQACIDAKGWRYGWKSNTNLPLGHWHCGFAGERRLNRDPAAHELPEALRAVWEIVQRELLPGHPVLIRGYANSHTYGVEGYPHKDSTRPEDRTAVIYMNREWSRNWGGETAFFDEDEILASIMPKFGRVVVFPSAIWHCARGVSRLCPDARVTVVFKCRPADVEKA